MADSESDEIVPVVVQIYNHPGKGVSQDIIASLTVERESDWSPILAFENTNISVRASDLLTIAQLPDVVWVGERFPRELNDEVQGQILAAHFDATKAGPSAPGYKAWLDGLGFSQDPAAYPVVTVTDDGVGNGTTANGAGDPTLTRLGDGVTSRLAFARNCTTDAAADGRAGHGHINTSIISSYNQGTAFPFLDPNGYLRGLGINPYGRTGNTKLFRNSGSYDISACGGTDTSLIKTEQDNGALISSNSWGCSGCAGTYDDSSQAYDVGVRDADLTEAGNQQMVYVFSAGNSGSSAGTIGTPGNGKNMITVGASENDRPSDEDGAWTDGCAVDPTGADNAMDVINFSSRGPAPGGRVKPEVIAPGTHIQGTASTAAGYDGTGVCDQYRPSGQTTFASSSGTSHSTPAVAGVSSLYYYWLQNHYGETTPSPALIKAYMIAHPTYLTGVSANDTLPSNSQGYGMPDMTAAFDATPKSLVNQTAILGASGETWTWMGAVADPAKPVRIVMVYTDAAGAIGTSPQVNNLNLSAVVNATTYLGNRFSGQWSTTGGSADTANNYEAIFLPAGTNGAVNITVTGFNIAGDGVPNNADTTDQDFALVCYNCAQNPDFSLSATPPSQDVCAPSNAVYTVNVGSVLGFANPVTLGASGHPAGTTATFVPNPVTPPGASTFTIGATGSGAPGSYTVAIDGTAIGGTPKSVNVGLKLYNAIPAAPVLTAPANGATSVSATPTFTWNAVAQAAGYSIQVATDSGFTNIVASATGLTSPTWTSNVTLNTSSTYHWRVWAANVCGTGAYSSVFSFTTVAAPGDCGPGTTPNILYQYGFEAGASGWTHSAAAGTDTWAIITANPHSGASHFRGLDSASVSDQRLVSPAVALPVGQNPVVLKFWHLPSLEDSSTGCYDGGILEISTDGGSTWTQVPNANLLVGPYTGAISSSFSNPLGGLQGWCGGTVYINTIADVSAYAGQTAQFRLRLGTDTSFGDTGWDVDDVTVQSCMAAGAPPNINVTPASLSSTQLADTTTSQTLTVGNTGGADLTWTIAEEPAPGTCTALSDVPWLSEVPTNGTTTAGGTAPVAVTFNSTGLAVGTYTANLCVTSNDPDAGPGNGTNLVVVPVSLTVTAPAPSISLAKTVGTVAGVCATTDSIIVAPGTTVYYCYTVTNTGNVTLNLHDLVDDQLGTIFAGLGYALAPGSSVDTVAAGLSIPAVINATTTNSGTWTAYNAGPTNQATATDTATVTVQAGAPAITLSKTVGTVPGVCATTDNIAITAGTTVYYCYQATNTGNVTLNAHSLVDDKLGTLLNNFPYALAPGASSPEVIVPAMPMATVTNNATWTAVTSVGGYAVDPNAAYNFIPIETSGTPLGLSDDGEANITLPFSFTFFGVTSSNLRVGNNGGILFNATTGDVPGGNAALPTASPALSILPFWDDIDSDTGDVYWAVQGTAPNRVAIIEWYNRPHYSNTGSATFQVLLYEGTDEIKFQYADVDFGNASYDNGVSATVGINKDATTALQVSYNQAVIQPGQAILFTLQPVLSASATDSATVNVTMPSGLVCNTGPIAIPGSGTAAGPAAPYPSTITVAGQLVSLTDLNVWLLGMSHTFPDDVDILLVGPQGQNLIVMSDAGSSYDLVNVNLVFDDAAASMLPDSAQITSGTYKPSDYVTGDAFPAPAPAPSSATALATFNGTDPNGDWSLYVYDDAGGDIGNISGGWCVDISAETPVAPPNIDVDPLSLSSTQAPDTTTQQTLNVGNTGEADLNWTIVEEPASVMVAIDHDAAMKQQMATAAAGLDAVKDEKKGDIVSRGGVADPTPPLAYNAPADFSEGFEDITLLPGQGWFFQNNSSPLGLTDWFQGNTDVFNAQAGPASSYIGANFNNTGDVGDISNWMLTPEITLTNGDTIAFWTRTATGSTYADRLQVRLSTAGSSTNVGTSATDVGDFTTLLLDINPALIGSGYPQVWTQYSATLYSATLSGLPAGATGRIAFRYFVTDAGLSGNNSNYIGIDTVQYTAAAPAGPCDAPSDVPWLSEVPTSGTTAGGGSTPVQVTFDSTGLATGTYTANLCIDSNDPDPGPGNGTERVIVPVTLVVSEMPSVRGYAFLDANEDGLRQLTELSGVAGLLVSLTQGGSTIATTLTVGSDGWYSFGGLSAGNYCAQIVIPPPYVATSPTTVCFTLAGQSKDLNFGLRLSQASLGDYVWYDANGDGIQDASESGIPGVTLALWSAVGGAPGAVLANTTTGPDGQYAFSPIVAGDYFVQVTDTAHVLAGLTLTVGPQSKPNPFGPIALHDGDTYLDADFGYTFACASTRGVIAGHVWNDADGSGIPEPGEAGIPGIQVAAQPLSHLSPQHGHH